MQVVIKNHIFAIKVLEEMHIDANEILDLLVSYFEHTGSKRTSAITLKEALDSFRDGIYGDRIEALRKLNTEEYRIEKTKLPAITFCGEFEGGHAKSNLVKYNNLLILDVDKLSDDEIKRIKGCFNNDDYVFSYWTSPSGQGMKGLIYLSYPIDIFLDDISRYHTFAFRQVRDYFLQTHNIELDNSGSDTSRLCFVTVDEDIITKTRVKPFAIDLSGYVATPLIIAPRPTKSRTVEREAPALVLDKRFLNPNAKNNPRHKQEILAIIKFLKKKNRSITHCYDNWYRTAFGIANTFSCDLGEKYFMELCRLDGAKHDEDASKKILIYSYENSMGLIGFGTILHFATEQGYVKSKRDSIEGG